jgi:CDP-2,3-bis-(O-geranylgeranyl)-sn-glycerol synthase
MSASQFTPEPLANAVFLISAMAIAGVIHVVWLRSRYSKSLGQSVDCGLSWRGHRLFGENKLVRGFVAMPPAAAASFALIAESRAWLPDWLSQGLWEMSTLDHGVLGCIVGLAFMVAELPNSFVKRQLGVAPGEAPVNKALKPVFFIVDRLDSVLGALIAISVLLPIHPMTWVWVIALGAATHGAFSVLLHAVGEKKRAL